MAEPITDNKIVNLAEWKAKKEQQQAKKPFRRPPGSDLKLITSTPPEDPNAPIDMTQFLKKD